MDNKAKDITIGKRIAQLRRACGLTQQELADDIYISRSCLANYETGYRQPDVVLLQKLSRKFNIPVNSLLNKEFTDEHRTVETTLAERRIQQYLTDDNMLNLSDAPALVRIILVEMYLFLMKKYKK